MKDRNQVTTSEALQGEHYRAECCKKKTRLVPVALAFVVLLSLVQFKTPPSFVLHFESNTTLEASTTTTHAHRRKNRVDLKSCPSSRRPLIVGEYNPIAGSGHRLTQLCSVLHFTLLNGYCICITKEWPSPVINELLLSSLFQPCPPNATVQEVADTAAMKQLMQQQNDTTRTIFRKKADELWNVPMAERGYGGLLAFVDRFFRDNYIPQDTVYPAYLATRGRGDAFLNESLAENVIAGVVHIRVGDNTLEKQQSYWENLFQAFQAILNFERGPDTRLHLYFAYFQALHYQPNKMKTEEELLLKEYGKWPQPSDVNLLPKSHAFIADICNKYYRTMDCFWKRGTSLEENIDMFVHADLIYVSGSSYSQTLALFNAKNAIKLSLQPRSLDTGV